MHFIIFNIMIKRTKSQSLGIGVSFLNMWGLEAWSQVNSKHTKDTVGKMRSDEIKQHCLMSSLDFSTVLEMLLYANRSENNSK